jgi:hypothetical protein
MNQNWLIHFGWVKALWNRGKRTGRPSCQRGSRRRGRTAYCIRQDTANNSCHWPKEGRTRKVAETMAKQNKGAICRSFFPTIEHRLMLRIPITSKFTAIVSGHRKTKSYLQRFKIIDNTMSPCNEGTQSSSRLIYDCKILERQRNTLKHLITASGGTWPTANSGLVENIHMHFQDLLNRSISNNCYRIHTENLHKHRTTPNY